MFMLNAIKKCFTCGCSADGCCCRHKKKIMRATLFVVTGVAGLGYYLSLQTIDGEVETTVDLGKLPAIAYDNLQIVVNGMNSTINNLRTIIWPQEIADRLPPPRSGAFIDGVYNTADTINGTIQKLWSLPNNFTSYWNATQTPAYPFIPEPVREVLGGYGHYAAGAAGLGAAVVGGVGLRQRCKANQALNPDAQPLLAPNGDDENGFPISPPLAGFARQPTDPW
jgi:hypothetical protein